MNRHSLPGLLELPVFLEKLLSKNKEVKSQKIPAPGSRPLEEIPSQGVMWSIIP